MKKSYLKSFINAVLLEQASQDKHFDSASKNDDYAIVRIRDGSSMQNVILYDKKKLIHRLKYATGDRSIDGRDIVVSFVTYKVKNNTNCYSAAEVRYSAAKSGTKMGIIAYESALYYATLDSNGLYADRGIVSKNARSVWEKYLLRNDVGSRKFDDIDNPKTPEKEDDCNVHKSEALDNVYSLKTKPSALTNLENSHKEFIEPLNSGTVEQIKHILLIGTSDLFEDSFQF